MKNLKIVLYFLLVVIAGVVIFSLIKNNDQIKLPPKEEPSPILGCYVASFEQDLYTMNIQKEKEGIVTGTLNFDNFEKDSSSGSFYGTYQEGILLADYSFKSEGMDSVMQVVFKKKGNNFIRGYGDVNSEGTNFINPQQIVYEESSPLSFFKKEPCLEKE